MSQTAINTLLPPLTQKEWESLDLSPAQKPAFDIVGPNKTKLFKFFEQYCRSFAHGSLTQTIYDCSREDNAFCSCYIDYRSMKIGVGTSLPVSRAIYASDKKNQRAEAIDLACQDAIVRIQDATAQYFKPKEDDQKKQGLS